jgi:hypothetical protein
MNRLGVIFQVKGKKVTNQSKGEIQVWSPRCQNNSDFLKPVDEVLCKA